MKVGLKLAKKYRESPNILKLQSFRCSQHLSTVTSPKISKEKQKMPNNNIPLSRIFPIMNKI
jgi:hypothetical protein